MHVPIDVLYDLACPWCYIGWRQLRNAIARRPKVACRLRWRPFLLNPELPADGLDYRTYLLRRYGNSARINRAYAALSAAGEAVGIRFTFDRIRRVPNTIDAHRFVQIAEAEGCADSAVETIFSCHFTEGEDIGARDTLISIGRRLGIDPGHLYRGLANQGDVALVHQSTAKAQRIGVAGLPAFIFAESCVLCGAQDSDALVRMIDLAAAAEAVAMPWQGSPVGKGILY